MADFRSVQTRMWREDEWFDELDTEARLFWIYLFTNPSSSPAGIFRLTMRTMSNESGIPFERSCELMERFAADKKAYYNGGVVWIVNMRRLQFPDLDGSGAWQIAKRMQDDIAAIPDANPLKGEYLRRNGYPFIVEEQSNGKATKRVEIRYQYPMDTISVNKTETYTETETETETKSAATGAPAAHDVASRSYQDWREFIQETPNKAAAALDMFKALYPKAVDVPDYGRIGATAKHLGGWGRLAELLWQHSAKPPSGDVLAYIEAASKSNGKTPHKPAQAERMPEDYASLKAKFVGKFEDIIEH